jgi:4Fe-4S ferredoxin
MVIDFQIDKSTELVRANMAFAVHVNLDRCTGCNNCVVACPVNALELHTVDPVTKEKIYCVKDGRAVTLDVKAELCAGCGVCVEACPYDVIRLKGRWEAGSKPTVVYVTE